MLYQKSKRHPIRLVCYRLSYLKGALLSRSQTAGLEEIGIMVGPVDVESSEKACVLHFFPLHQHASEVFNLEQIEVWTMATAIVGLVQAEGRACMSNLQTASAWQKPGGWYRLGKLYEQLGIQHPTRWLHVSIGLSRN